MSIGAAPTPKRPSRGERDGDLLLRLIPGAANSLIDQRLRASGLPVGCADAIRDLARRTRLALPEKLDLVQEMIWHFQDGLEAGESEDELLASFGDVPSAALLIRRAKIRGRPATWHVFHATLRATQAFVLVTVLTYVLLYFRLRFNTPTISHNYLAELNAPTLAIPPEQRAWTLYKDANAKLRNWPNDLSADQVSTRGPRWAELRALVDANRETVATALKATRLAHLGALFGADKDAANPDNPNVFRILLPEIDAVRRLARLLRIDALAAAETGDEPRAMADFEGMLRIVEHLSECPFLITELVALAILGEALDSVGEALRWRAATFSDEALTRLEQQIRNVRGGEIRLRLGFERIAFIDFVQRVYSDNDAGDGVVTAALQPEAELIANVTDNETVKPLISNWTLPAWAPLAASRAEIVAKYDEFLALAEAEARVPLWRRGGSLVDKEVAEINASFFSRVRYLTIVMIFPSLSRASLTSERVTQQRDALLLAIALERYRRQTGAWPETLDALRATGVTIPVDRFDGAPLRYRLTPDGPLIYSVGADLDDDGGVTPSDPGKRSRVREWRPVDPLAPKDTPPPVDGDWVLWPQ